MSKLKMDGSIDFTEMVIVLSDGNPDAATVLTEIAKHDRDIDPQNLMGWPATFGQIDYVQVYGESLYCLWSDVCDRNITRLLTIFRANQLGYITAEKVREIAEKRDYSGKNMIDLDSLYKSVKSELLYFDRKNLFNS